MDAKNLADLYGLPLIDWARVEAALKKKYPRTTSKPLPADKNLELVPTKLGGKGG